MAYIFPGFDCEINEIPWHPAYEHWENRQRYPTAIRIDQPYRIAATTMRETRWQSMMNNVTDDPDWQNRVQDERFWIMWKQRILEYGISIPEGFSEQMADQMIKELQQKANDYRQTGWITAFDPGIIKSDAAVSTRVKNSLQAAIKVLEDVSDLAKDWHPDTNPQILNLVDPSLYSVIYGQTKVRDHQHGCSTDPIADMGTGTLLPAPAEYIDGWADNWPYSDEFQWLPAEMRYNENKQAKFSSYINNFHPQKHRNLYQIIEKVVDAAIPLWSRTLSSWPVQQRIVLDSVEYEEEPEIPKEEDESEDDYVYRVWDEFEANGEQYVIQPEPHGNEIDYKVTDLKEKFPAGLQVIVKLQNIELQPGDSYDGGIWHVEGQGNEHIVATALYYYDSHNVAEGRLAFRHGTDEYEFEPQSRWHTNFVYKYGGFHFLPAIFGLPKKSSPVQNIGSVRCQEGRLITFPNTFQYCVSPFKLQDESKPGHRKVLALFLVDPNLSIISSRSVPPQQQHWWTERIQQTKDNLFVQKLPLEIQHIIFSYIDDSMPLKTAKEWRSRLMENETSWMKTHSRDLHSGYYEL